MKEHGKLFKGEMVRAILSGTKTQTRRPFYVETSNVNSAVEHSVYRADYGSGEWPNLAPGKAWTISDWRNVKVGDRIWVRESLGYDAEYGHFYAATMPGSLGNASGRTYLCSLFDTDEAKTYSEDHLMPDRGVPSIHLPRRYSRITLEVTEVRVERLQSISESDARAEGMPADVANSPRVWYAGLWDDINGRGAWQSNPWVFAVSFRRLP